jgi:hypothetical protein
MQPDKRGMLPIFVLVPMTQTTETNYHGTFRRDPSREMSHEVIGVLSDYPTDGSPESMESIKRDLAGFGVATEPLIFTREIQAADGFVCCAVLFAVAVPTIESARGLPSFVPLYEVFGPAPSMPMTTLDVG